MIDQPTSPRPGESLDGDRLGVYLQNSAPELGELREIKQFPGGFSNLTYLLETTKEALVLRRPPHGAQAEGGHNMLREYDILARLHPHFDRVPRPVHRCEDTAIIGAPFYLMERVEGMILRAARLPRGFRPDEATMRRLSEAVVDQLAELHALDVQATGLVEFGRPEGYIERQVAGWIRRYRKAETDEIGEMNALADWLPDHMPEPGPVALLHNDYKYDNLVLDPAQPSRIRAILDWEMATVGDARMDLGTMLAYWIEAKDPDPLKLFNLSHLPGNLPRRAVVERYAQRTGREPVHSLFFFAFACFKIGTIAQQIYARYKAGFTQDPRFAGLLPVVNACGRLGTDALERDGI